MEDAGQVNAVRTTLEELPEDAEFDYDPEYCTEWFKINAKWKQQQYKMEWPSSRIVSIGSREDDMEAIYKLMECSLCLKICPLNSKACNEGHIICPTCMNEVSRCPFEMENEFGTRTYCLSHFSKAVLPIYGQLHEAIGEEGIVIRCQNRSLGCPDSMQQEMLWKHQSKCKFRPEFACNFDDCFVGELTGSQLIDHLVQFHKVPLINKNHVVKELGFRFREKSSNTDSYSWTLAIFIHNNVHFLLCMAQDEGQIFMWASTLEEEMKEKYSVKIRPKDKNGMVFSTWDVVPPPYCIPKSYFIKNRRGFCQTLKIFMNDYVRNTFEEEVIRDEQVGLAKSTVASFIEVEIHIQTENEKLEAYTSLQTA